LASADAPVRRWPLTSFLDGIDMTLLVAGTDGKSIWMVADTAITGGDVAVRDRQYQFKIIPSRDGQALIGFAGEAHHGSKLAEQAALMPAGKEALALLLQEHRENQSIDFAYAYIDDAGPHLVRLSQGEAQELQTLHIGLDDAFEHFQRIRHDPGIDAAPEAISQFIVISRATDPVPTNLSTAITSMLRLFAERSERDVGGWPVAYQLTDEGAFLCGYGYSVSDPILTKIGPGSIVPHGTPEAGGFGLSVTELGKAAGVVVYWLQQPGGTIFRRTADGYEPLKFSGTPSLFIESASAAIGNPVEIFFGDQPTGSPESIAVIRDEQGMPCMAIARSGRTMSFSVLNVGSLFRSRATLNLQDKPGGSLLTDRLTVALSDDRSTATLDLLTNAKPATQIKLEASELDAVLAVLGEARALMRDKVPVAAPDVRGAREVMILDPAWRTTPPMHPSLSGIILRLRHIGFGWLTFLLPHHEAQTLGDWLTRNSQRQSSDAAKSQGQKERDMPSDQKDKREGKHD
jgi:hypothetical protein